MESFENPYFSIDPNISTEDLAELLKTAQAQTRTHVAVAEDENGVIGLAHCDAIGSYGHATDLNISVHPKARKKGIATALVDEVLNWAQGSAVVDKVQAKVAVTNDASIGLLKKTGFEEVPRQDGTAGPPLIVDGEKVSAVYYSIEV